MGWRHAKKKWANVNATDDQLKFNALIHATSKSPDFVKLLLKYKAKIDCKGDSCRYSALTAAANNEKHGAEITQLLIDHKADVNSPSSFDDIDCGVTAVLVYEPSGK